MTQSNIPGRIACPNCGQTYAIQPEQWPQYQGQTIACTKCGKPFTVGGVAPVAPPAGFAPPPPGAAYPVGYGAYPPQPKKGMPGWAIALLVVVPISCILISCLISILLPALNKARQAAQQIKCASNLKNIGLACMMYANANKNSEYPDSVQSLVAQGGVSADFFVCPASNDMRSTATGSQLAADLAAGGHDSYIYVGKGLTSLAGPDAVLMYEPLTNHNSNGINVLYADGHVMWLNLQQAEALIQQLQTSPQPGVTPTPTPGPSPAPAPAQ